MLFMSSAECETEFEHRLAPATEPSNLRQCYYAIREHVCARRWRSAAVALDAYPDRLTLLNDLLKAQFPARLSYVDCRTVKWLLQQGACGLSAPLKRRK